MHPLYARASELTEAIIGAAIQVHRDKGPGLLESIYEWCMTMELEDRHIQTCSQKTVLVHYKNHIREEGLRFDLLARDCVLIEIKAVDQLLPIHKAQLLSYMKLLDVPVGLLINFNSSKVTDSICRLVLPGSNMD